jgi:hypothetical protein
MKYKQVLNVKGLAIMSNISYTKLNLAFKYDNFVKIEKVDMSAMIALLEESIEELKTKRNDK